MSIKEGNVCIVPDTCWVFSEPQVSSPPPTPSGAQLTEKGKREGYPHGDLRREDADDQEQRPRIERDGDGENLRAGLSLLARWNLAHPPACGFW